MTAIGIIGAGHIGQALTQTSVDTGYDVVDLGPLAEGWRVQRDTPGHGPDLDADQLREAAAPARRYREMT